VRRLCDELLRKRDPAGYYVIVAKPEALSLVESFAAQVEQSPSALLVKVKSRSVARKLCLILLERNLLVSL